MKERNKTDFPPGAPKIRLLRIDNDRTFFGESCDKGGGNHSGQVLLCMDAFLLVVGPSMILGSSQSLHDIVFARDVYKPIY